MKERVAGLLNDNLAIELHVFRRGLRRLIEQMVGSNRIPRKDQGTNPVTQVRNM